MMQERSNSQILVVGGRTTGLTLACELARHGAPVRIVDKSEGIDPHCRATVLHSRTLEVFQDLGIVDEVLEKGTKVRGLSQYVDGRRVLHVNFGDVESPCPWGIALGQNDTEAILERQLGKLGITVERRTELVDFVQNEDQVRATILHADGRDEEVLTPWLIGCDGAHSTTRHLSREAFGGEEESHQHVLADVIVDADFERDVAHSFLTDRGVLFFFPLPQERTLVIAAEHHEPTTEAPTLQEIQALVTERGPAGARVRDPHWLAHFHIHYRIVSHYRHRRVFLAGDAAHIHSPVGGQGMNTGIQDAYNLAWKLALAARGRGSEIILASYEKERRDVGEDVVRATQLATESFVQWDHLSPEERKRRQRMVVLPEAERRRVAQHREALDLDYRKSPICAEGAGNGFAAGPHAGAQAPDAGPLECGGRTLTLFELLRGTKHTLLVFPGPDATWQSRDASALVDEVLRRHGDLLDAYIVTARGSPSGSLSATIRGIRDPDNALTRRYGIAEPCFYLIRPDGYVAYRAAPPKAADLRDYLQRIF
jgi:2-polyprenyl-6-methoxyphenol hydroxylase-like FAD-dependent oxidoreductase